MNYVNTLHALGQAVLQPALLSTQRLAPPEVPHSSYPHHAPDEILYPGVWLPSVTLKPGIFFGSDCSFLLVPHWTGHLI